MHKLPTWRRLDYVLKFPKEWMVAVLVNGFFGYMKRYVLNATASQSLNEVSTFFRIIRCNEYVLDGRAGKSAEDEFFHTLRDIHRHELLAVAE